MGTRNLVALRKVSVSGDTITVAYHQEQELVATLRKRITELEAVIGTIHSHYAQLEHSRIERATAKFNHSASIREAMMRV